MKKLLMLLGILALSTGMVVAQDTATQDPQSQPQEQPAQPADPNAQTDVDVDVDTQAEPAAQDPAQTDDAAALPQTASPLPLIALLGLGALAAGLVSRRK